MPPSTTTQVAKAYFEALGAHDLDAAVACWEPGAVDRLIGLQELVAPGDLRDYFGSLFAAFPDFRFEIISQTTSRERCAVRWRASGTFAGPGRFQGLAPNGAQVRIEGCDVVCVKGGLIVANDAYLDTGDLARQLGVLPAVGSRAETLATTFTNVGTVMQRLLSGSEAQAIAGGVWVVRGGRGRKMNCYLIEDEGGVTVFDAGISAMGTAVRTAATRLGGIRRVVLGHADCDHRGSAPALGAPVYCHPLERSAAENPSAFRDYWDLRMLSRPAQLYFPRLLRAWNGGAVQIAGTVEEGEQIAGFEVVHLPGHAPGMIGLFRAEDRLALVSDCFYTVNPETGLGKTAAVPHPAFNHDTDQARDSIRKLAALQVSVAWAGHGRPVSGADTELQLQRAAVTAV